MSTLTIIDARTKQRVTVRYDQLAAVKVLNLTGEIDMILVGNSDPIRLSYPDPVELEATAAKIEELIKGGAQ